MIEHRELPSALDEDALAALSGAHHDRTVLARGTREAGGHLVKVYGIEAPGRAVADGDLESALRLADRHLSAGPRGSLGLAVLIAHAGGDGDYVLVHTWIEAFMSDLAIFTGPPGRPDLLRPARTGLAPCVWEAAVLAHERTAFSRHLLDGASPLASRVTTWATDTLHGPVR
ncbi:hypothetical protein LO762_20985 [Actinocorallia sp. API 0066]|uniref:hypothetical protein n=1 Tax=Actinocorallia sp. API 0066 TaxID=2896846 RepID=UPI001E51F8CD|nr:hypothetical protein [Actinocorallia sp. API 0066]MCD0451651.1 hypothetical protein [Actinocorallia sp. API 0066]